ncbi:MAG: DUF4178 domain-containing protein [Pseudomonadota bacterium]
MQIVSCPSCGAQVAFRSHASVMAVCAYCDSTVMKEADAVKDLGKMSSVLEDYSPLRIGSGGTHGGRQFSVIGRIQLRYAAGMWNEWHVLFDDGGAAWLGDSSGLYTLTVQRPAVGALPALADIKPGKLYTIGEQRYTAAEVRTAECVAGQGELPFKVGPGYRIQVADFRQGGSVVTLDYSDGPVPTVFGGEAVTLEGMGCQLLRDAEQIKHSAGTYRGKLATLDCPACGGQIKFLPGVTRHLVCPACSAALDAASPKAEVVRAGERLAALAGTLELGAQAKIKQQDYQVIGLMRRADDDGEEWTEYLLYGARGGFFWLVETNQGWWRAEVMAHWPQWHWTGSDSVQLDQIEYAKLYEYGAQVRYAAGAFNWRVVVGDRSRVYEFGKGPVRLAAEITDAEMTWSRSTPLAHDQIKTWFGKQFHGGLVVTAPAGQRRTQLAQPGAEPGPATDPQRYRGAASKLIMFMLALNAVPLLGAFSSTWHYSLLGALAIYLPAHFLDTAMETDDE